MKRNHTLQSKEQDVVQSYAATQASHGLEGPLVIQTNLSWVESSTRGRKGPHVSVSTKGERLLEPGPARATSLVGRRPMGPTAFKLRRGSSSLVLHVGLGWMSYWSRPRSWWLPSINMRAPNWVQQNVASTFICRGLRLVEFRCGVVKILGTSWRDRYSSM